ncbi:hypothetical protein [Wielerella bovis]|uniref:hypothetical protein n=1 Tax=Wielerella bovis TaxID=2917790 RepID=UPI002019B1BF|nr:hypothetical protein [Wielerella bovis]ULJ63875.1 hypothetical protein MIS33_06775 [Wielerella bovis]ULJ65958.1 hypothetical protein MIS31_06660 [Wielerella bovis]
MSGIKLSTIHIINRQPEKYDYFQAAYFLSSHIHNKNTLKYHFSRFRQPENHAI